MLALGIAECVLIALSRQTREICAEINKYARKKILLSERLFTVSVKYLCPAVLICLSIVEILRLARYGLGYPVYVLVPFGVGLSVLVIGAAISLVFAQKNENIQKIPIIS